MAEGVPDERARACARLALGNAARARYLASPEGEEVRGEVESFVAAALAGGDDGGEPWRPLLQRAESRREAEEERLAVAAARAARARAEGPRAPGDRARARGRGEARRPPGAHRVARPGAGADRADLPRSRLRGRGSFRGRCWPRTARPALAERARSRDPRKLREAAERCEDLRQALELNVTEDLALSALGFRLSRLVGAGLSRRLQRRLGDQVVEERPRRSP